MQFRDRRDAGRQLAAELTKTLVPPGPGVVVLALPRGGVPVGLEVAAATGGVLDVFVARKIGAPGQDELGIGAVAEGTDEVVVAGAAAGLGLDVEQIRELAAAQQVEVGRRISRYRSGRPLPDLAGRDVVLVDDGLATGVTAEAALRALRGHHPRRLVLAVPVCAPGSRDHLATLADEVVCLATPQPFRAVGAWYEDFRQTTDDEVVDLLTRGAAAA